MTVRKFQNATKEENLIFLDPDYYKETLKQYYQKFNLPEPSIAIKVIDNYNFGTRRRIENFKFSSLDKKFICIDEEFNDYAMQFDGIRLDSGPHAGEYIPLTEIIPLIKSFTGKKLAHEFSKLLKGRN